MSDNQRTLRIRVKRVMVAIMSVLLVLTLMTTISFSVLPNSFAEGEENVQQESTEGAATPAEGQPAAETAAPAEGQTAAETAAPAEGQTAAETAAPAEGQTVAETAAPAEGQPAAGTAAPAEGEAPAAGTDIQPEGTPPPEKVEEDPPESEKDSEGVVFIEDDETSSDPLDTGLRRQTTAPKVSSSSYIVMSGSTSEIVLEKHSERKMAPGDMTFLMTAMVVIDNMYNDAELNNTVDITKDLTQYGDDFKEGETVSVGDLLKAMLVGGSGQAAEALATYSASSRKIFIREMNSKAMELGLMDTHFSRPRGEYNAKTYSTAHDIAVIAQAAIRYQIVKDDFALRSVTVKAVSSSGEREVTYTNTNPLLTGKKQSELYNLTKGGILGKIGDPVNASQYVGLATVDDMQLIVVLMDSKASKIAYEAKALLEYGDTKVTRNIIIKANKRVGRARVKGGNITHVRAYTETKGFAYVPPEGSTELIQTQVVMFDDLVAPLKEGTKVGEYRIYVADELKGTVDLIIKTDVTKGWPLSEYYISNLTTIIIGVVILLIILVILRIMALKRRRKKLRQMRREKKLREIAEQQLAIEEDRKARNWEDRTGMYGLDGQLGPRTGDLREEARRETIREELIAEAAKTGTSPKTIMKKAAKTEQKKEAAKEKAKKKTTSVDN